MGKLQLVQTLGSNLVLRFNERKVIMIDDELGNSVRYEYDTAKVCKTSSYSERIEALIKTRYPTVGSELAAMHKGGEAMQDYLAFRELAKQAATDSFEEV